VLKPCEQEQSRRYILQIDEEEILFLDLDQKFRTHITAKIYPILPCSIGLPLPKILWTFTHNVFSNLINKQSDRQTKQQNENISFLMEVIKRSRSCSWGKNSRILMNFITWTNFTCYRMKFQIILHKTLQSHITYTVANICLVLCENYPGQRSKLLFLETVW